MGNKLVHTVPVGPGAAMKAASRGFAAVSMEARAIENETLRKRLGLSASDGGGRNADIDKSQRMAEDAPRHFTTASSQNIVILAQL